MLSHYKNVECKSQFSYTLCVLSYLHRGEKMSFAKDVKGRELAVITKLLAIFGIVETRQMRQLFEHLTDKQYGSIMSRLTREGLVYYLPGGKHLATSRFTVEKCHAKESIQAFWVFIKFRNHVLDFCASSPPAILSFTSGETDYDLIAVSDRALKLLNGSNFVAENQTVHLFAVSSIDELSEVETRMKNDYAIEVGPDGVNEIYEL